MKFFVRLSSFIPHSRISSLCSFWESNSVERYDEISKTCHKLDILARIIWIAIHANREKLKWKTAPINEKKWYRQRINIDNFCNYHFRRRGFSDSVRREISLEFNQQSLFRNESTKIAPQWGEFMCIPTTSRYELSRFHGFRGESKH